MTHPNPRNLLLIGLAMLALTPNASAVIIEFTAAEGYTDGNLWSQTPTGGNTWNTITDYQVNTAGGGSVTAFAGSGSNSFPARYSAPVSSAAGQSLSLSMDFQFLGVDVTTLPASSGDRQYISTLSFGTSTEVFSSVIGGNIATLEFAPVDTYSVQVFTNAYTSFSPSSVGLTTTGGTMSDNLRMTLTTTVAPVGNSTYTLSLFNVDTNTLVFSLDGSADLTTYSDLFAGFSGGGSPVANTSLVAYSLDVSSVPEPSSAVLVLGVCAAAMVSLRGRFRDVNPL